MLAKSKISAFVIAAAVAAGLAAPRPSAQAPAQNAPPQPARQNAFAPDGTPITLGLAGYAKVLCSAVFVSGRDAAEAFENSGFFLLPEEERRGVTYDVDRKKQLVRMTHGDDHANGEVLRRSGLRHPSRRARRDPLHAGAGEDDAARRRDAAVADGRRAAAASRRRPTSTRAKLDAAVDARVRRSGRR